MTDNRTTELRISEPLRGFIRHQSNRAYIDGGQARWLTEIADEIDAKHEQAVDDARIVEVETSYIDIEQGEVITRFVPEQAIAATLGSGMLTAEQVMAIAAKHQPDYCSDTHVCFDWQAIADELNARAERTCECVAEYAESPFDGKTMVLHRCSKCHELMRPHMRYCPNCGRKVVDA